MSTHPPSHLTTELAAQGFKGAARDTIKNWGWVLWVGGGLLVYILLSAWLISQFEYYVDEKGDYVLDMRPGVSERTHWTFLHSCYFTVINVETVGFGDTNCYPRTKPGKVIAGVNGLVGIVGLGFLVAIFSLALQKEAIALPAPASGGAGGTGPGPGANSAGSPEGDPSTERVPDIRADSPILGFIRGLRRHPVRLYLDRKPPTPIEQTGDEELVEMLIAPLGCIPEIKLAALDEYIARKNRKVIGALFGSLREQVNKAESGSQTKAQLIAQWDNISTELLAADASLKECIPSRPVDF